MYGLSVLVEPVSQLAVAWWDNPSSSCYFLEKSAFLKRNPNVENDYDWTKDKWADPYKAVKAVGK